MRIPRHRPTAEPPAGDGAPPPSADTRTLVAALLGQAEQRLAAAAGDRSLCSISRSAGSVPAAKHLEGQVAALRALRRALGGGQPASEALPALLAEWSAALADVTARDAGPDWRAYRAGGVDALNDLTDALRGSDADGVDGADSADSADSAEGT